MSPTEVWSCSVHLTSLLLLGCALLKSCYTPCGSCLTRSGLEKRARPTWEVSVELCCVLQQLQLVQRL